MLDLAVKASAHPPAAWCTRSAKVGDRVAIQVGGKFVLREAEAALFVAGGVGLVAIEYSWLCAAEVYASSGAPAKHRLVRRLGERRVHSSPRTIMVMVA